ncbi:UDP-N-acetylglucosamine 2-epimerase [Candidatus Woesebacteria bacterium]|nr:MAG: UDP-N-acetylglucosamine 2-epimerase [Candidatus Woesebacteria bacterium]
MTKQVNNQTKRKTLFVFMVGTTAELIRVAPILIELKKRNQKYKIILSGQNNVRVKEVEKYTGQLETTLLINKSTKPSVFRFGIWAVKAFILGLDILHKEKMQARKNINLIIYGDPVTTTIGAIIAKILHIKIIHIESGDLSKNLKEPFPEEICRNINIRLADVLFPPSTWATNNLKNIHKPKINTHFNTLLEGFNWYKKQTIQKNVIPKQKYYILILHRQEHVIFRKNWSKKIIKTVIDNSEKKLVCVLFNHPITVKIIKSLDMENKNIKIMPLINYSTFIKLMEKAEYIATDGATNQFEAYLMGKPCLLLREHTEQIEGLNENVVLSKGDTGIINDFLTDYKKRRRKPVKTNIKPSEIIVNYLLKN